jgi:peptidoglycan/xylan/chitin deacetylase (PgdA/CDA1 family)
VTFQHLDLTTDPLPGPFDLVVCSEILYFVGQRRELRRVAVKLRRALRPGGYLLMAHSNVLADDPSKTGFDWDVPFGAEWIEASFAKTPFLSLVKAIRTPLYRIHLFRRSRLPITTRAGTEVIQLEKQPTALPARVAAHVAWDGTDQQRGVGVERVATERLPILMYHRVAPEGRESARRYRVTPDQFEEQLEFLQRCGYHGIDLDAWRTAVDTKRGLTGRAVLITFDDATEDFAESAWPLLQRYGFPTTLFVPTAYVGRHNAWDEGHGDRIPLLSWDELADLARAGLHVGAHSCTHPYMTTLSNEEVVREAVEARVSLWEGIGKRVDAFAYPYGDSDPSVRHLVGASGYRYGLAVGSVPATFGHSLLALPRIEVNGQEPFDRFIAYLGR